MKAIDESADLCWERLNKRTSRVRQRSIPHTARKFEQISNVWHGAAHRIRDPHDTIEQTNPIRTAQFAVSAGQLVRQSNFGTVSGAANPRVIQLATKIVF